jgi:hypothetical protein
MRTCSVCKKELDDEDFAFKNKRTGRKQNKCKKCQNEYSLAPVET